MEFDYKRLTSSKGEIIHPKTIKNCHGLLYPAFDARVRQEAFERTVECFAHGFIASYLDPMILFKGEDKALEADHEFDNNLVGMLDAVDDKDWMPVAKEVIDGLAGETKFARIETPRYSAHILFIKSLRMDEKKETPIIFYFTDAKKRFSTCIAYTFVEDYAADTCYTYNTVSTIFYFEDKYNCAKDVIASEQFFAVNGALPNRLIVPLKKCINVMSLGKEIIEEQIPSYKPTEIKLLKKLLQIDPTKLQLNIGGYNIQDNGRIHDTVMKLDSTLDRWIEPDDLKDYPILDLSKKEDKFINKYCDENYNYADGATTDLVDLFSTVKMRWFRFDLTDENGNPTVNNIVWHVELDKDNDMCRMFIIQILEDYMVHIIVDMDNIHEYNVINNLVRVKKNVIIRNQDHLLSNEEETMGISELCQWDCYKVLNIVEYILRVMVVMRDRPQRTKIVKCTEKRRVYKNPKNPKQGYVEKEFVIHRILKSTADAKEYVKEKSGGSGERHFEYVMEEWERRAHTRQLKSGKIIYIGETTCHRHKDLTDKEIHIKL